MGGQSRKMRLCTVFGALAVILAAAGSFGAPVPLAGKPTCRALALSGGGDKGAYEAGVISGLVKSGENVSWDVVTGISAGSIITAATGLYAVGQEAAMAEFLVNTSLALRADTIYKEWAGGDLVGLLEKSGLFDTTPERAFLSSTLASKKGYKGRKLVIGATNDVTGKLDTWNETHWNAPDGGDFVTGVMASSAIPGAFPTVSFNGNTYSDGGVTMGINVYDAVNRCRAMGAADPDITVDIVACSGDKLAWQDEAKDDKTIAVLMRAYDLQKIDAAMHNIYDAKLASPSVNWRYLIFPSTPLPGSGLNFNPAQMKEMVEQGESDAAAAVKAGGLKCDTQHANVPCNQDKDCLNWVAAHCPIDKKPLKVQYCRENKMCHIAPK